MLFKASWITLLVAFVCIIASELFLSRSERQGRMTYPLWSRYVALAEFFRRLSWALAAASVALRLISWIWP